MFLSAFDNHAGNLATPELGNSDEMLPLSQLWKSLSLYHGYDRKVGRNEGRLVNQNKTKTGKIVIKRARFNNTLTLTPTLTLTLTPTLTLTLTPTLTLTVNPTLATANSPLLGEKPCIIAFSLKYNSIQRKI